MRAAWLVSVILVGVTAGDAAAQSAEAEKAFRDGKKLMAEQKYAEACEAFATSQRLAPGVSTKLNLADCREKNGQLATSWGLFLEVSMETRDDPQQASLRKVAKERADKLEPRLSYLTVSVPDESRVEGLVILRNGDGLDPGLWNRAVPVDGGSYVIEARAPAHEAWSTTVEIAAEAASATVDVPQFKQLVEVPVEEPVVEPPPPARVEVVVAPSSFTSRRKLAVGVGVAGVLAIAAGGALSWTARGLEDDALTLCPGDPCDDATEANDLVARAETRALFANVAFGVGAAAVIGAAVLWLTGAPDSVSIVPTSDGLAVAGRF